ncbi:MAG: response regulator [Candidatus Melainabacteria bacterium]|nr:response regulator [Candidatus Melainabacteria bacterium]
MQRVLIVDDDDNIRELAQMGLEGMTDWKVDLTSSGAQALQKASAEKPDVIILDQTMPNMDGLQTFQHLKEDPVLCKIPVIMMTGKAKPVEIERFLELGFAGVIPKPFDPITLCDDIENIVTTFSAR